MMLRSSKAIWWAGGAALWFAQGCMTLDDLKMKEDPGSEAETEDAHAQVDPDQHDGPEESEVGDARFVGDAQAGHDASTPLDAQVDATLGDSSAGPDVQNGCSAGGERCADARPPILDGTLPIEPDVQPLVCHSNAECGAEQLCVAEACRPRCNADGACIVYQRPQDRSFGLLTSDERALYFGLNPPAGAVGSQKTSQLWRRAPGHDARLVTDQLGGAYDYAVQDGYAYFRKGSAFQRVRVETGAPIEELYSLPGSQDASWAVGADFLVISVNDAFLVGSLDGKTALHRIEHDAVSRPFRVLVSGDRFYFASTTQLPDGGEQMRMKSVRAAPPYTIEDASPVWSRNLVLTGEGVHDVRPPYAYFGCNSIGVPCRINLIDGAGDAFLGEPYQAVSPAEAGTSLAGFDFKTFGKWLYVSDTVYDATQTLRYERMKRYLADDPSVSEQVVPRRLDSASNLGSAFQVLSGRLYTISGGSRTAEPSLIYEMPLAPTSCTADVQCAESEKCGPSAVCIPKCQDDGSCIAFQAERAIAAVHTHADSPYLVLDPTTDGAGNPKSDSELWQVVPQGQSRRVVNTIGDPRSVVLKAGYAYYRRGKNLHRVSLQPGSTEQLLYTVSGSIPDMSWVVGDTFIAISTNEGIAFGSLDGAVALRKIVDPRPTDSAPRLLTEGDRLLFAYTERDSSVGPRFYSIRMVEPYALSELTAMRGRSEAVWPSELRNDFLYYWGLPAGLMRRVDVTDGTDYVVGVQYAPPDWVIGEGRPVLLGDWVYTIQNFEVASMPRTQVYLGRCSTRSLGTCQTIVSQRNLVSTGMSNILGVAGDKLYGASGQLLYELELPSSPCNAQLPCAAGATCGDDHLCH